MREQTEPLDELRQELAAQILAGASPGHDGGLFPADARASRSPAGFFHGAAGVLWALAGAGEDVPGTLVDHLVATALGRVDDAGPALDEGLSGLALALDLLGRRDEAARLWRRVETAPLERLGCSLASGLPGVGLALLERAPIAEPATLVRRAHGIAARLARRLQDGHEPRRPGLLRGGAGAALFLLHVYDLTGDETLLGAAATALRADLALLGWAPFALPRAAKRWRTPGTLATGAVGVAVVLHEAADHLDAPWVLASRAAVAAACEEALDGRTLTVGNIETILGLQYIRSRPWESASRRLEAVQHLLDQLGDTPGRDGAPVGLVGGLAGAVLALKHLGTAGDRRLPFFW